MSAEEPVSVEPIPVRELSDEEVLLRSSLPCVEPLFVSEPVTSPNFTVELASDESLPARESLDEEVLLSSSLSFVEPLSELFLDALTGSRSIVELPKESSELELPRSLSESFVLPFSESCPTFLPDPEFAESVARPSIDSIDVLIVASIDEVASSADPSSAAFNDLAPRPA